jgi:cytochrome c oxidase subunit 2
MWKIQHPSGRWENNELHVPLGRPIVLTMTSEDVIHSFFVPAFRVKMDVVPGTYTRLPFRPTRAGVFRLFCAEFCGTDHSKMVGTVTVMQPAEYERWLQKGPTAEALALAGQRLFIGNGCNGCHGANASVRAPRLEGIYGKPIPIQIPPSGVSPQALRQVLPSVPATTIIADERYIHDSIVLPEKEIAAGFSPIMPTFRNRLTEQEILQIVAYIKSLGNRTIIEPDQTERERSGGVSAEEYRARVGFTPANVDSITAGSNRQPARGGSR